MFNKFGRTVVKNYSEVVGLPFIRKLIIQKNENKSIEGHQKLRKVFENQQGKIEVQEHQ
jgi:hypothetical protein